MFSFAVHGLRHRSRLCECLCVNCFTHTLLPGQLFVAQSEVSSQYVDEQSGVLGEIFDHSLTSLKGTGLYLPKYNCNSLEDERSVKLYPDTAGCYTTKKINNNMTQTKLCNCSCSFGIPFCGMDASLLEL